MNHKIKDALDKQCPFKDTNCSADNCLAWVPNNFEYDKKGYLVSIKRKSLEGYCKLVDKIT